jgi:hypothetical protein
MGNTGSADKSIKIPDQIKSWKKDLLQNTEFQKACVHVHDNYLSKPYSQYDKNQTDYVLYAEEFTDVKEAKDLYRPNNGLANTIRTAILVYVLGQSRKSDHSLELAIYCLFWKTGRKNDAPLTSDDGKIFIDTACSNIKEYINNLQDGELKKQLNAIHKDYDKENSNLFQNYFTNSGGLDGTKDPTEIDACILRIATDYEMVRCCDLKVPAIESVLKKLGDIEACCTFDNLLELTLTNINRTGDRIELSDNINLDVINKLVMKELGNANNRCNPTFYKCSTSVLDCLNALLCEGEQIKSLPTGSINVDVNDDATDSLNKTKENKKDNLTNKSTRLLENITKLIKEHSANDNIKEILFISFERYKESNSVIKKVLNSTQNKYLKYKNKYDKLKKSIH